MDEAAQCIYRNDGVIWHSLSECTGEPDYESLGGFWLAEDNADENVTGPLLGTVYQMHYTLHQYSVQYAKYLQYLFCASIWEKAHAATNPTDFPLHLSSNGSFMYWETLIKEAGKRRWMSGWDERRKGWKKWCGYVSCTLQRKSVFFFFSLL